MRAQFETISSKVKTAVTSHWLPYWSGLNDRERRMLWGLLGCVALFVPYLIYAPLKHAVTEQTQQLHEKKVTLEWMKASQKAWQSEPKGAKQVELTTTEALSVLSRALNNSSLRDFTYELQQVENDGLQLSFEKVPYQLFLTWLFQIDERYLLSIKSFRAEKTETSGLSRLQVVLGFTA